jgi:hypothetical protein
MNGGSGVSPGFDTTQHALVQKKAKRSGQAERSGKERPGVSPDYGIPTCMHAEEGEVERSVQAESSGEGGVPGSIPTTAVHLARTPKKAKPSVAARPSAAEKGGFGVSHDCGNPPRTPAEEGQAERCC